MTGDRSLPGKGQAADLAPDAGYELDSLTWSLQVQKQLATSVLSGLQGCGPLDLHFQRQKGQKVTEVREA